MSTSWVNVCMSISRHMDGSLDYFAMGMPPLLTLGPTGTVNKYISGYNKAEMLKNSTSKKLLNSWAYEKVSPL